jgi:hypothetical protein
LEASGNPGDGFGLRRVLADRLAVLGWKFWQKKSGYPGDIISFGREKWGNWAHGSDRWGFAARNWAASGFGMGS